MDPSRRAKGLRCLLESRPDEFLLCREEESRCHAASLSENDYIHNVTRSAFNMRENRTVCAAMGVTDEELARGTPVGQLAEERKAREDRLNRLVQEKYDELDDQKFEAIVRCSRCRSEDVSWEEKQTRSADEGATLFCVCRSCKHRWVVR